MSVLLLEKFKVEVEGEVRSSAETFVIKAGEVCALVGKNGSGKSSLLSGIMALPGYSASGGCFYLDASVEDMSIDEKARAGITYVAQKQPEIDGLSLIQLLYGMYTRTTEDPLSIIAYKTELTERLAKYSIKSELLLRPIGVGLSGGEKKQAELITLIAANPKLALIDEIDSGVDINMLDNIAKVINDIQAQGSGVLIISHNFELLQKIKPSKIYLAQEGVVSYHGTAADLEKLKENGFVAE